MGLSRAESPLLAAEPVSQVWPGLYGQISLLHFHGDRIRPLHRAARGIDPGPHREPSHLGASGHVPAGSVLLPPGLQRDARPYELVLLASPLSLRCSPENVVRCESFSHKISWSRDRLVWAE